MRTASLISSLASRSPTPQEQQAWLQSRQAWHQDEQAQPATQRFNKTSGGLERAMVGNALGIPAIAQACSQAWGAVPYADRAAAWRTATAPALQDPQATVRFDKCFTLEGHGLGGVAFTPKVALPATVPARTAPAVQGAGAVVAEADGRVWLCEPAGGFGGHRYALPKGGHDGCHLPATARREVAEELGLQVQLTASLGIFNRDLAGRKRTQFYLAQRQAGDPACAHWETFASVLTPVPQALQRLTNPWDRQVLQAALYALAPTLRRTPHAISAGSQVQDFVSPSAALPALVLCGASLVQDVQAACPSLQVHALCGLESLPELAKGLRGSTPHAHILLVDDSDAALRPALAAAEQASLRCVGLVYRPGSAGKDGPPQDG